MGVYSWPALAKPQEDTPTSPDLWSATLIALFGDCPGSMYQCKRLACDEPTEIGRPLFNPLLYIIAYLFGYFSGSGLVGLFCPNRELEPKDHATEVLGQQG